MDKQMVKGLYDLLSGIILLICLLQTIECAYQMFAPYYLPMSMTILAEVLMMVPAYLVWKFFRKRI